MGVTSKFPWHCRARSCLFGVAVSLPIVAIKKSRSSSTSYTLHDTGFPALLYKRKGNCEVYPCGFGPATTQPRLDKLNYFLFSAVILRCYTVPLHVGPWDFGYGLERRKYLIDENVSLRTIISLYK